MWKKCPAQIGLRAALQKPAQLKQPKKINAIRPPSTNQGPYISLELNILLPNVIFKNYYFITSLKIAKGRYWLLASKTVGVFLCLTSMYHSLKDINRPCYP